MTAPLSLYLFSFYISSRDNGHLANPQHSALSAAADKKRREKKPTLCPEEPAIQLGHTQEAREASELGPLLSVTSFAEHQTHPHLNTQCKNALKGALYTGRQTFISKWTPAT